jgi:hypothetical protein
MLGNACKSGKILIQPFSSRIATIERKLSEILEACNSNARGIEQLNAHVELFMTKLSA